MIRILFFIIALLFAAAPVQAALPAAFEGEVLQVVDGDTVRVRLQIWIGQSIETNVRILGLDAPEIHGKCAIEREKAQAARRALADLLGDGKILLRHVRNDKYAGRVLAMAQNTGGTDITSYMLAQGLARGYQGKKRGKWC
jgi:micrococcal nuclease